MAKSLRSKWKRKMRAIKREKMDVKVLARMKKMLRDSAAEQKLDAKEEKLKQQKALMKSKAAAEMVEAPPAELPAELPASESPTSELPTGKPAADDSEVPMDTESDSNSDSDSDSVSDTEDGRKTKFRKPSTKTMRNEKNQFPVWMSTKKIRRHKRLAKKKAKRNTKEAKKIKQWKIACSA